MSLKTSSNASRRKPVHNKCLICLALFIVVHAYAGNNIYAQFRSKASGNWSSAATWEYNLLGAWLPALGPPGSGSGDIYILAGHTITVNSSQSLHNAFVSGTLDFQTGGSINIANVLLSPGELAVNAGGILKTAGTNNYTAEVIYGSGSKIHVLTGGKITVGNGGAVTGTGLNGYASSAANTWDNGSRFEWNSSTSLPASGVTYFPNATAGIKPYLMVETLSTSVGGAAATVINGMLQVEHSFSLQGAGAKTFRDGIIGSATLTIPSTSGTVTISGSAPVMGGSNLRIITDKNILIPNGLTIPADSVVTVSTTSSAVFSGKAANSVIINGTLDIGTAGIDNSAGAVVVNGIFKTAHPSGLAGGAITGAGTLTINTGSTLEYNAAGNQQITGTVPYHHFILSASGTKTAPATLTIKGNFSKSGSNVFLHNNGTVLFNGTAGQSFFNTSGTAVVFYNMTNSSTGTGLTINDSMVIARELLLSPSSRLNLAAGNIVLRSTAAATAHLAAVPNEAGIISYNAAGRFIVERYLPAVKAWRFVATPVRTGAPYSPTITQAWREAGAMASTGYGTQLTGPAGSTGMDAVTSGYSMKWYNMATNSYTMVSNTNDLIANNTGYMVFVRGDRAVAVSGTTGITNLRIKGELRTGNQSFPVNAGAFQSIGNPYASAFGFQDLLAATPGLGSYYIAWDPTLNGNYGAGGFQTLSAVDGFKATAPGSSFYIVNTLYPNIESGQAFFVYNATGSALTATVTESMKKNTSRITARETTMDDRQFIRTRLYTSTGEIADGNIVAFDDELGNDFDADDAIKFTNSGENFGMSRFGKKLSVEARNRVQPNDTIHYSMSNLKELNYRISILPEGLSSLGMEAYFVDRFLNTHTAVSLSDTTNIIISITSNAASKAANRFYLVFKAMAGPLPVTFVSVAAQRRADRSIDIKWKVANEINIKHYEVERSANGIQFRSILTNDAQGIADYNKHDLSPLATDNFYRIKAADADGSVGYSAIVKVSSLKAAASISVYPNPVVNGQMSIQFTGQVKGNYVVRLVNGEGQLVYKGMVNVTGDNFSEIVQLGGNPAPDAYQLSIQGPDKKITNSQVLLQ